MTDEEYNLVLDQRLMMTFESEVGNTGPRRRGGKREVSEKELIDKIGRGDWN